MTKENMELLNSMSTENSLIYAEKLVFGTDGVIKDLSAGMNVIKREANTGNPQAEFLMYKVNISKGKINAAMEWLKKSYKNKYGLALAMTFYEFERDNIRKMKEDDAYKILKEAVAMDVPVAHYFLGIVYQEGLYSYNKNEKKAQIHFDKAKELGFEENFLDEFQYEIEIPKYNMDEFRGIFQRNNLLDLVFKYTEVLAKSIADGNDHKLIERVWKNMIINYQANPDDYLLNFDSKFLGSDDAGNVYYYIEMEEIKSKVVKNIAIYFMIVFNENQDVQPKLYLGELDYSAIWGRNIFVIELSYSGGSLNRINQGTLSLEYHNTKPNNENELFINRVVELCNC